MLGFYGDDFTGSTDALEILCRAGAKTVLFIAPPRPEQLARYQGLQAIGVAGLTRSMPPGEMEQELPPAFAALKSLGVPHVHYKVCSTFDSSPAIGSIGKAIDIGAEIFARELIPLLVAAPALGRYSAFGNLFARMGIGSKEQVYRLDRHPSMSRHPVTPAEESDLRLHLSHQTSKKVGLMDLLQVALPEAEARESLDAAIRDGAEVILFDAIYETQMAGIGRLIDGYASSGKPLFSAGSSGIEMALGAHWIREGQLQPRQSWPEPGRAKPLLVASGSCSPVTSRQIARALSEGFAETGLDTTAIACRPGDPRPVEDCIAKAVSLIGEGRSVILHTSLGDDDQRVQKSRELLAGTESDQAGIRTRSAQLYGRALGRILREVVARTALKRAVIAGGDTSSFAARELAIEAVEMIAPLSPGAPLCRAYAPGSPANGLEIVFKGGQVGREDFLLNV